MIGIKQRFAYCTTKGAVLAMTRQLAVEYAKELRVNAICPGTVETPFVEGYLDKYHAHEKEKFAKSCAPASRWAAWASLKKSLLWCATYLHAKPDLSAVPCSRRLDRGLSMPLRLDPLLIRDHKQFPAISSLRITAQLTQEGNEISFLF
jgi:hypothetical protein